MDRAWLSDRREQVLTGEIDEADISDATRRQHVIATRQKAQTALTELIRLADSPHVENSRVFDPGSMQALLEILVTGGDRADGVIESDPWDPDPEYARQMGVAIDRAQSAYRAHQRRNEFDDSMWLCPDCEKWNGARLPRCLGCDRERPDDPQLRGDQ